MHVLLTLLAPVLDPIARVDVAVVKFFNQFAGHSYLLDRSVAFIEELFAVKGALFMAALYYIWFLPSDDVERDRTRILRGFLGTFVALAVALALNHFLPLRLRPLNNPALGLVLPSGAYEVPAVEGSFPSDHGAMFFAVSTIIWQRSRAMGIAAYLYTAVVICLPRIYAGHHYPSDLVAGGLIGIFFVWLAVTIRLPKAPFQLALRWERYHPSVFYALVFMLAAQVATLFWDERTLLHEAKEILEHYR